MYVVENKAGEIVAMFAKLIDAKLWAACRDGVRVKRRKASVMVS